MKGKLIMKCDTKEVVRVKFNGCKAMEGNLAKEIYKAFKYSKKEELIIFNIGVDTVIGDALGPFIGTMIKDNNIKIKTIGTLDKPVHAGNLEHAINFINNKYPNAFILSIDAAVGNSTDLGLIIFKNKPIIPGAGVGKQLQSVGDYSIIGIMGTAQLGIESIKHTRISFVMNVAKNILNELIILDNLIAHDRYINHINNVL